ncbi:hypothetical protein IT072_13310 [Leifsonia sp. ZF2019]|nr:hypothetical protein [Leifsonia sp. ZF2019]UAJ78244.1 hypothetical protein IT072_13310 [Leifsonia sp. ZF2019]
MWFIEPNLAFELESVDEATATIAVEFFLEAAPPGTDGREVGITLALPIEELGRAAAEWERDIAPFPPR